MKKVKLAGLDDYCRYRTIKVSYCLCLNDVMDYDDGPAQNFCMGINLPLAVGKRQVELGVDAYQSGREI